MIAASVGALVLASVLVAAMTTGDDDNSNEQPLAVSTSSSGEWTTESYSGGPRLAVDRTEIAYGDVAYGQPVEAVYRLKNVGDEVVTIDEPDIKTLEGC